MLIYNTDKRSFKNTTFITFTSISAITQSVIHSEHYCLNSTVLQQQSVQLPVSLEAWEQMFGRGGFHTLTRKVKVLFATVSRWPVATARISTSGAIKLSKCLPASHQTAKWNRNTVLQFVLWSDISSVGSIWVTGFYINVCWMAA